MKALTGMPPMTFVRKARLHEAKTLLETGLKVAQVAYAVGFTDPNYFSRVFSREFKQPPSSMQVK